MLGGRGGGLEPPHILGKSEFFGSKRDVGEVSFYKSFHVCVGVCMFFLFCLFFFFIYFNVGRRGKTIFFQTVCADNNPEQH